MSGETPDNVIEFVTDESELYFVLGAASAACGEAGASITEFTREDENSVRHLLAEIKNHYLQLDDLKGYRFMNSLKKSKLLTKDSKCANALHKYITELLGD